MGADFDLGYREFNFEDLCWSTFSDNSCTYQSPGGYFQNNLTRLLEYNDAQIADVLLCTKSIDPNNTLPCEDETGIPVQKSAVFGALEQIYHDNTVKSEQNDRER